MLLKQLIELYDRLDSSTACGATVKDYLLGINEKADVTVYELKGNGGKTDMIRIRVPGINGKAAGKAAPTMGILGRLGGLGARPERIGFVSDGDGALIGGGSQAARHAEKGRLSGRRCGDIHPYLSGCTDKAP